MKLECIKRYYLNKTMDNRVAHGEYFFPYFIGELRLNVFCSYKHIHNVFEFSVADRRHRACSQEGLLPIKVTNQLQLLRLVQQGLACSKAFNFFFVDIDSLSTCVWMLLCHLPEKFTQL